MRILLSATAFASLFLHGIECVQSPEPAPIRESAPLATFTGRRSKILDERLLRITSAEDWKKIWLEHKTGDRNAWPPDEALKFDLSKVMLLAAFQGEGVFYSGFQIDSIREDDTRITVRLYPVTFQVGPGKSSFGSSAWAFFVLPKSTKGLVVEHSERSDILAPHKWSRWKVFPPIAASHEK